MRDLNECKAEVFRRSKKRIQARRKARNRVLACCIPLCLLVAVSSVTILPKMLPAGKSNNLAEFGSIAGNTTGSYVCSYTEVVIWNADSTYGTYDDTQRITDKVEVTRIFEAFFDLDGSIGVGSTTEPSQEFDNISDQQTEGASRPTSDATLAPTASQQTDNTSRLTGYIITFITEDGAESVYTLDKNALRNIDKNTKTILSDAQVEELKTALGIFD